MKKTIALLALTATTAGCMTVGNDGGSYVSGHVRGTETDPLIKQACTFDNTVITGVIAGGIALLLGADANQAAGVGAAAGLAQNVLSQQACNKAQIAYAQAIRNPGQQYTWSDPSTRSRGQTTVVPIAGTSNGWAKTTITLNGKTAESSKLVKLQ